MSKIIKPIDNETIEISDYRKPNAVFNTNEYQDYEDLCVFKETIRPFELYAEHEQLKDQLQQKENIIKEVREYIESNKIYTNKKQEAYTLKNTWYGLELLEILDKGVIKSE